MDPKKYTCMEKYLHTINQRFISLSDTEERQNNVILTDVLEPLVQKMRQKDKLFKMLYKKMFFGGSYYDGLKVGSPNEYDIDLLLTFPAPVADICNVNEVEICNSNKPGFVHIYLHNRAGFEKVCEFRKPYIETHKVLSWMEGVVQRALNDFDRHWSSYIFAGRFGQTYYVKVRKQGPAFTLDITDGQNLIMNVDLMPCFSFDQNKWPGNKFRKNPYSYSFDLSDFFVVPKHAKGVTNYGGRYWRLSFQKQERQLIHDKGHLKPALRLLKKMRDVMQTNQISSYFLKTVVLWDTEEQPSNFWVGYSLSYVFMHILKKYQECLKNAKIPYFWNKNYNLLDVVQGDLNNTSNRLLYIIKDIDMNVRQNPAVILKYILTPDEQRKLFPEEVVEEPSVCLLL